MKRIRWNRFMGKLPKGAKNVQRPTRWGNPFRLTEYSREESMRLFRQYLTDNPDLVEEARSELMGHDLACNCSEDVLCHGDIWIEFLTND